MLTCHSAGASNSMSYTQKRKKVTPLTLGDSLPSPRPSCDSEHISPGTKPAFQRQCSSPSFVESYARYVEQLQQNDQHKQLMEAAGLAPKAEHEQTIKAAFPGDNNPTASLGAADSSHKSWPSKQGFPSSVHPLLASGVLSHPFSLLLKVIRHNTG